MRNSALSLFPAPRSLLPAPFGGLVHDLPDAGAIGVHEVDCTSRPTSRQECDLVSVGGVACEVTLHRFDPGASVAFGGHDREPRPPFTLGVGGEHSRVTWRSRRPPGCLELPATNRGTTETAPRWLEVVEDERSS